MKIEKIEAWKTLDGQVFVNETAAIVHANRLEITRNLQDANEVCWRDTNAEDVMDHLVNNAALYCRLLRVFTKEANLLDELYTFLARAHFDGREYEARAAEFGPRLLSVITGK